jgi:hypothetical protein
MKHFKVILIFTALLIVFFNSCKKLDDLPLLGDMSYKLYPDSVLCSNSIIASASDVSERGVCWSTKENPSINDYKTIDGRGIGKFESKVLNLAKGTKYYLRAYATNNMGTIYGDIKKITTYGDIPILTTISASNISSNKVTCGGSILFAGTSPITEKGLCWSLSQNPTILDSKIINDSNTSNFANTINNLIPNTIYYVSAYATNSKGTGYGEQILVKTNLTLGAFYQGGIVGYIFQPEDPGFISGEIHGIIVAQNDQSASALWGCYDTNLGAYYDGIGAGLLNTEKIVKGCSQTSIGVRLCYDLVLNGYTDWYLPSNMECIALYNNRLIINQTALEYGGKSFDSNSFYWTSTEQNDKYAKIFDFLTGQGQGNLVETKNAYARVRAIRYF